MGNRKKKAETLSLGRGPKERVDFHRPTRAMKEVREELRNSDLESEMREPLEFDGLGDPDPADWPEEWDQ